MKNILLLMSVFILACDGKPNVTDDEKTGNAEQPNKPVLSEEEKAQPSEKPAAEKAEGKLAPISKRKFDASVVPKEVMPPGAVIDGLAWEDRDGTNVVVFTRDPKEGRAKKAGDAWMYAKHLLLNKGMQPEVVREIKQRAECDMEADLVANWRKASFGVTDLDNDSRGEATFAYRYTCTTDVSPMTYKLFVIEKGEKYTLRGNTRIEMGSDRFGGEYEVDKSFETQPEFLEHAKKVWKETMVDKY